jgi:hypothetical protein
VKGNKFEIDLDDAQDGDIEEEVEDEEEERDYEDYYGDDDDLSEAKEERG